MGATVARSPQKAAEVANRRPTVLDLRIAGYSQTKIAEKLGISQTVVSRDLRAALADLAQQQHDEADQLRTILHAQLSAVLEAHWANRADPNSARIIVSCLERVAKMYGIDAPLKVDLAGEFAEVVGLFFARLLPYIPTERRAAAIEDVERFIPELEAARNAA